jgi:hypothetical protein
MLEKTALLSSINFAHPKLIFGTQHGFIRVCTCTTHQQCNVSYVLFSPIWTNDREPNTIPAASHCLLYLTYHGTYVWYCSTDAILTLTRRVGKRSRIFPYLVVYMLFYLAVTPAWHISGLYYYMQWL